MSLQLWLLVPAVVMAYASSTQPHWIPETDFAAYYATAAAQWQGVPAASLIQQQPSLSPPTLSIVLWPLTWLPLIAAFWVWFAVNVALVVDTFRLIRTRVALTPPLLGWFVLASLATVPCFLVWSHGQLGWLVGWCLTRAWLSRRSWQSGVWMGLAIALKPTAAAMVLALPLGILAWSGVSALAISGLGVLLMGVPAWRDWLTVTQAVTWLDSPYNLSVAGWVARLHGGHPTLHTLSLIELGFIAAGAIIAITVARLAPPNTRWAVSGLTGILISPIGWMHYLPSVMGPMLADWPRSWTMRAGVILLAIPGAAMLALLPYGSGWLYPLGFLLVWLSFALSRH